MRKDFLESPVTIVFNDPDGYAPPIVLASEAWLETVNGQLEMSWGLGQEVRSVLVAEMKVDEPGRWEFKTSPRGVSTIVRPVREGDVVASSQFNAAFPLPVDVIAASLKGFNVTNELQALVGDDGYVRTILLVADIGLYTRYSGSWHKVTDESQIDGLNAVDVQDEALDVYDPFDQAGQLVRISSLPTVDPADRATHDPEPTPPPSVTAGGVEDVQIMTARDVPRAVEIAARVPSWRWYVERRVQALGINVALPWKELPRDSLVPPGRFDLTDADIEELPVADLDSFNSVSATGMIVNDASMVALYPDRPHELQLPVDGAEDPEVLHLTLCVLKKPDEIDYTQRTALNAALQDAAFNHGPYDLDVTGIAEFNPDDNQCCVLLVNGDGLEELRNNVKQCVDELGLERDGVVHPWVPHITLGYGVNPSVASHLAGHTIRCSSLASVCGPDKYVRMLGEPDGY